MEIKYEDYEKIKERVDSINTEKELKKIHKNLLKKTYTHSFGKNQKNDCALEFMEYFLSRDWGRSFAYEYSKGAIDFIKSNYVSEYFKEII